MPIVAYYYLNFLTFQIFSLSIFKIDLYSVSIKSPQNEVTLTRVVKEVKGLNPSFDGADIRG